MPCAGSRSRRPDLDMAVQAVADGLTAGEGVEMIHQAALQQFLWWHLPRDYPDDEWHGLVEATAALLDELGLKHLAEVARSEETQKVLAAWGRGRDKGAAAFRAAQAKSGVEPPDTALLAWGSIMGVDEARALDTVERALGDAVATGDAGTRVLHAGKPRPRPSPRQCSADHSTCRPDRPWLGSSPPSGSGPGSTLPATPCIKSGDRRWRTVCCTRSSRPSDPRRRGGTDALAAGARRGARWHRADPEQLPRPGDGGGRGRTLRLVGLGQAATLGGRCPSTLDAARRGEPTSAASTTWSTAAPHDPRRRTARRPRIGCGNRLLAETEDGEEFTRAVTEVVGLSLLRGRIEQRKLVAEIAPILVAQGWATGGRTDHRQPCLVGGVAPAAMVANVRTHSTRWSHVGVRYRPGAHAPHGRR